jgi:excisionase family DNA binding protein
VVDSADRLLTPREIAAMLGLDRLRITRWAATGRIKGAQSSDGQWRFRESAIRAAMAKDNVEVKT